MSQLPPCADGRSMRRERVDEPPPQECVHVDHAPGEAAYSQSTGHEFVPHDLDCDCWNAEHGLDPGPEAGVFTPRERVCLPACWPRARHCCEHVLHCPQSAITQSCFCAHASPAQHVAAETAPTVALVLPAAHATHCVFPVWLWYCPAAHSGQPASSDVAARTLPARPFGQRKHALLPSCG